MSVEAVQDKLICVADVAVAARPAGTDGAVVSPSVEENVAVMVVFAVTTVVQLPVPEHPPPDQPVNFEPLIGVAVIVTDLPEAKLPTEQTVPQEILPPEDATVPLPTPALTTVNVKVDAAVDVPIFAMKYVGNNEYAYVE